MTVETINTLISEEVSKGIEEFKRNYINTQFEKNKLYDYLGKDIVELFKKNKAVIAGGTITSLFSNRDINDIDVYFRNELELVDFLYEVWGSNCWIVSNTNKATQFLYNDGDSKINIQLIHFKYFNNSEDIFDTFDYTACMGTFDFATEEFILHPDFLKHNSQRILKFNSNTAFPIVSLLRVQKYENKGYYISKPEFIRIVLTCMNLDINTYDELKDQLGGMYGVNLDKLFENMDDKEFDLQEAIDKIANITLSDDYFIKPKHVEFEKIDDIIDVIRKEPFQYLTRDDKHYRIEHNGILRETKTLNYGEKVDGEDYFSELKVYKFVRKENDTYSSYYRNEFKYKINETVIADNGNYNDGKLYFNYKNTIERSAYYNRKNTVLIEATINKDDFKWANEDTITTSKSFITREVPEEEWKQWFKDDNKNKDLLMYL